MIHVSDRQLPDVFDNIEIVKRIGERRISHVFHDIDGTHSLIREWPPVMSAVLQDVIDQGLPPGYDSDENMRRLVERTRRPMVPELERFCIESAGLSALTQMEWSIRRAVEAKSIPPEALGMNADAQRVNSEIIQMIWKGREKFDDIAEPDKLKEYLRIHTPPLFRLYERVLHGACRDANLAAARGNPAAWRVPGSLEFMELLHRLGARNYFVTGSVVEYNEQGQPYGGIYDEVVGVGFEIGPGKTVEAIHGSTWTNKMPKDDVMRKICRDEQIPSEHVMVIGDGRSEIAAGVEMNAVSISRLPRDAARQRELHKELGTNIILVDYTSPRLGTLFGSNGK